MCFPCRLVASYDAASYVQVYIDCSGIDFSLYTKLHGSIKKDSTFYANEKLLYFFQ